MQLPGVKKNILLTVEYLRSSIPILTTDIVVFHYNFCGSSTQGLLLVDEDTAPASLYGCFLTTDLQSLSMEFSKKQSTYLKHDKHLRGICDLIIS
ncbi:hypothetical protein LINGRAHAP2_LOCUS23228 [Linum grandiflorum]